MCIRIRRATRYVPPASQPRAAPPSPGWTQTCRSSAAVSSAMMLAVPSLNPNRLRGVTCAGEVDDVRPKPELRPPDARRAERRPRQVADRVHGDLRVVGAGLDDEVAVGARGIEVVGREVGQLDERLGEPGGEPEPVARRAAAPREQRPPEPEREREPGGREADRLAGVVGRRVVRPGRGPERPRREPAASAARDIVVQRRRRSTSSSRDVVVRSNAAVYIRSWTGVTMPAWWAPANG